MNEDIRSRAKLFEEQQRNKIAPEFQEIADERIINFNEALGKVLVKIYRLFEKPFILPKIFPISGSVKVKEIEKMPAVKIENFKELKPYFDELLKQQRLLTHAISLISQMPPKSVPPQTIIQKDPELNELIRGLLEEIRRSRDIKL